jgi:hypothetical protein
MKVYALNNILKNKVIIFRFSEKDSTHLEKYLSKRLRCSRKFLCISDSFEIFYFGKKIAELKDVTNLSAKQIYFS